MANVVYNEFKRAMSEKEIDWDLDTFKVKLIKTITQDEDVNTVALLTFTEFSDASYAEGTLANTAVSEDTGVSPSRVELDADDLTFSSLAGGETAVGALVYHSVSDIPCVYVDDVDFTSNGSDVTIQWNANGIIQLQ